MPELFPLEIIGGLSKVFLKMEFFFFLGEKLMDIGNEKQISDEKKIFEIFIQVGT